MTRPSARGAVVFRTAAGPRMGFGHVVRTTVLARALGLPAVIAVRGGAQARTVARRFGQPVVDASPRETLRSAGARLLVVDDPSARHARIWQAAAVRAGVPTASIHDLGLAECGADLAIDGSVVRACARRVRPSLRGPRYAILTPASRRWREPRRPAVLIALGGGPRLQAACAVAAAVRHARPDVRVRLAGGFGAVRPASLPAGVEWLGPQSGLTREFARATVAVVGGGVSLYEACRVGVPAVATAVVPAQRPTIAGLAARGAAEDGGSVRELSRAVRRTVHLLDHPLQRRRLSQAARATIDGRGTERVARALRALCLPERRTP